MANWGYVAIDKTGKEIKGSRDADTQEALTRDLKQQGLIVLEVKQQNTLTRDINISFDKSRRPEISPYSAGSLPASCVPVSASLKL